MSEGTTVLVVEDRDSLRRLLATTLTAEGYRVAVAATVAAALAEIQSDRAPDLVLTDLKLPDGSGLEVLRSSKEAIADRPVVVMTAYGSVGDAVAAMKLGAVDFLEKPVELDELCLLVASLIGHHGHHGGTQRAVASVFEVEGAPPIVGRHPRMRAALRLLQKVAKTESTVLLTGESGTGKELFALSLHALSPRRSGPFVALNCAAIPEALIENELFGHEKGAFTGASSRQAGRFEQAAGGTLLLDEIGELPPAAQAKVLRVLEDRTFERVGGSKTLKADLRLVAATNRDLGDMVETGSFRGDLFYRLEVFPIALPALRDRASDVPEIACHLLTRLAERSGAEPLTLSLEAEKWLSEQPWPGNVRQLSNVLERASILSDGPRLERGDLQALLDPLEISDPREEVRRALRETDGDKKRAAEILGISYRTLSRRIRDLDLEGYPRFRD